MKVIFWMLFLYEVSFCVWTMHWIWQIQCTWRPVCHHYCHDQSHLCSILNGFLWRHPLETKVQRRQHLISLRRDGIPRQHSPCWHLEGEESQANTFLLWESNRKTTQVFTIRCSSLKRPSTTSHPKVALELFLGKLLGPILYLFSNKKNYSFFPYPVK